MSSQKSELIAKVKDAIDQVRPYLQADGGNIDFVELTDDNVVKVKLLGACSTCPMGMITLKQGVEATIKKAIPEVKSVEAVNLDF